jgi:alpha-glucosidase/alpha-D-xyloside xylohydrolase
MHHQRFFRLFLLTGLLLLTVTSSVFGSTIMSSGQPARLDIREAGEHSIRVTLRPLSFDEEFPFTAALAERDYPDPTISLKEINGTVERSVGNLDVTVRQEPLTVIVRDDEGNAIQEIVFRDDGRMTFRQDHLPILGMGEGGPRMGHNWREENIEFDRRGRMHNMVPRWQSQAYGSRNPVALLIGTGGWGLFVATPWGQIDLRDKDHGLFIPWEPPDPQEAGEGPERGLRNGQSLERRLQGRPPTESMIPGVYDLFIFDGSQPAQMMKDISVITGPAVIPPKWSLGYMQSHRELRDDNMESEDLLLWVIDTFREKKFPIDSVVYLGTGFTPTGWNTRQPSFSFNPAVFKRDPAEVIEDMHEHNVKVLVHIVPWHRDRLSTLHGSIPPKPEETLDDGHILNYWKQHEGLVAAGIDAWWPDEGDWFNLFERIKRHQLYYQGPLLTTPNVRPWSLHRNGHLGIAQWGGWVWSGDTTSTWKTLEGQIAVGINHSLSLSPFWGSDTGGFYTTSELTGELYARWYQFSAFCPSFRSHGRIWRLRLPWGWGLEKMGFLEGQKDPPRQSEMNNPAIEPVCKRYANLRYRLIPYTYTLVREARDTGMPLMRAMWLHYPEDSHTYALGDQYLWGRDLLIAPVYKQAAISRDVYLPQGQWYDYWTNSLVEGGRTIIRDVNLATMPIYVRAGAVIPFDPVRQFMEQKVDGPTTIKVYRGADGEFTMYEDDGISLDYLTNQGATWTRMMWNDDTRRLTIEPALPAGAENQPSDRSFRVQLLPDDITKEIHYTGQRINLIF